MQTILSEAYADPQTGQQVGDTPMGPRYGIYVDGKLIATVIDMDETTVGIQDSPDGTYRLDYFIEDSAPNFPLVDLLRELDTSAILEFEDSGESIVHPAIMEATLDEHFSMLAYLYYDPATVGTDSIRACTYNVDIVDIGESVHYFYHASSGFKIWELDAEGNNPVLIG